MIQFKYHCINLINLINIYHLVLTEGSLHIDVQRKSCVIDANKVETQLIKYDELIFKFIKKTPLSWVHVELSGDKRKLIDQRQS